MCRTRSIAESRLIYERPLDRPTVLASAEIPEITQLLEQFDARLKSANEALPPTRLLAFDRLLRQVFTLYPQATAPATQARLLQAATRIEEAMQKASDTPERLAFIDRAFENDRQFWTGLRMPLTQLPWINYMILAKTSAERSSSSMAETEVTEELLKTDRELMTIGTRIEALEKENERNPTQARAKEIEMLTAQGQARIQVLLQMPDQKRAIATLRDQKIRQAHARIDRNVEAWIKDPTSIPVDQKPFILSLPLTKLQKITAEKKEDHDRYVYIEKRESDSLHWELQPRQIGLESFITVRCITGADSGITLTRPAREILTAIESDRMADVLKTARDLRKNSPRAHAERKSLNDFDLPKDQDVVCIRVFPKSIDTTLQTNLLGSTLFSQAVQSRYQNRDRAVVLPPILCTDDPTTDVPALVERVRRERGGKKLTVVLNINAHGTRAGFQFSKPWDVGAMMAKSEDTYAVHTMACHGAGLREHLQDNIKKNPGVAPRLFASFVTQPALPTAPLQGYGRRGGTADHTTSMSTDYEMRFVRALLDPKTAGWGAAHATADIATEDAGDLHNPEALLGDNLYTRLPTVPLSEVESA